MLKFASVSTPYLFLLMFVRVPYDRRSPIVAELRSVTTGCTAYLPTPMRFANCFECIPITVLSNHFLYDAVGGIWNALIDSFRAYMLFYYRYDECVYPLIPLFSCHSRNTCCLLYTAQFLVSCVVFFHPVAISRKHTG